MEPRAVRRLGLNTYITSHDTWWSHVLYVAWDSILTYHNMTHGGATRCTSPLTPMPLSSRRARGARARTPTLTCMHAHAYVHRYVAFDSDAALLHAAAEGLISSGQYADVGGEVAGGAAAASGTRPHRVLRTQLAAAGGLNIYLELRVADVVKLSDQPLPPLPRVPFDDVDGGGVSVACDLIVASGFADLLPPAQLTALLTRIAPRGLAYLPITFSGCTRLEPSSPGNGDTPSDERVVAAYHHFLVDGQQQHINVQPFLEEVVAQGGAVVAHGPSPWRVPPTSPFHAWMVDFLASGCAQTLWASGWDPAAWRAAVLRRRPTIVAENVDLLLQLGGGDSKESLPRHSYEGLEFAAPRTVRVVARDYPPSGTRRG